MKFQIDSWSCGPASIVNAARALGRRIDMRKVKSVCNTTEQDGTCEQGMIDGIRALGMNCSDIETTAVNEAMQFMDGSLVVGRPMVICVQNHSHWMVVLGKLGDKRYVIFDSSRTKNNISENGVLIVDKKKLVRLWRYDRCDKRLLYGISLWL